MNNDLYSHNHQKGCWQYHLEWCTKYRYNSLRKESIRQDCETAIQQAAEKRNWRIIELAVQPEHVHCIIETQAPEHTSKLLNYLKGYSSFMIFKSHPLMRLRYRKGHFWSRGSFSRTVGADLEVVCDYVRHQEDIHQRTLTNYQN